MSVMIPEVVILVVFLIYWFRSGEDLLIILVAVFLYLIPPQFMIFDFARRIGQFKGEWKRNHSERIDRA
ncbi:hypothetical protein E6H30_00265 [Candidatus Bathyarchaeota archaeon]|nr:MAG: hypothetical protein E6H30_00265 [Candidatus Bathyarchaeota archaeon]